MKKLRHKNANHEDFPVGKFIRSDLRSIVQEYYQMARLADDIADNNNLSAVAKVAKLDELENIFLGIDKNPPADLKFASQLGVHFKQENLATALMTDLLKAFRQDANGLICQSWGELINYCSYSAAPVGRFMLAIHDENPTTYLPATALCVVLQIVNHLCDAKYDFELLGRIYIPQSYADEQGIDLKLELVKDKCSLELKSIIDLIIEQLEGLLKDAKILPRIVRDWRLRMEIGVILSLTNSMIKRIQEGDVLATEIKATKLDWCKALGAGFKTALIK